MQQKVEMVACTLRACVTDVGEFVAGPAQPLSTIKETKYYTKTKTLLMNGQPNSRCTIKKKS